MVARLGQISMGAVGLFVLIIIALHPLRPDHDPASRLVSEYVVGPYGHLVTHAFIALGLGSWSLVAGLSRSLLPTWRSRAGLALLALASATVVVLALFPAGLRGAEAPSTVAAEVHDATALVAFVSHLGAMLLLSDGFRRDARWRAYAGFSIGLTVAIVVAFIGLVAAFATDYGGVGIAQRLFVGIGAAWLIATAYWLRRTAGRAGAKSRASIEPSAPPTSTST